MDSTIIAAIIGAGATIAAILIGWLLQRGKTHQATKKISTPKILETNSTTETAKSFSQRYIDEPSHYRFIKSLPQLKAVVMENAQEGWDTGVTADMRQASYDVIDFLEYAWLRLAEFYPENHWQNKDAESFIRKYIQDRFEYHWSKHEPSGSGPSGTIVGVLVGHDVINDLKNLINDTVATLSDHMAEFDYENWRQAWNKEIYC